MHQLKYKAFISYSHQDSTFGDWLHKQLETFVIPGSYVGKQGRIGKISNKLFPIFRDREELPTATDLGEVIDNAIEESASLIVICSPRSAKSLWVDQEIINYTKIHGSNNIVALIVDGDFDSEKPYLSNALPDSLLRLSENTEYGGTNSKVKLIDARSDTSSKNKAFLKLISFLLNITDKQLQKKVQRRKYITSSIVAALIIAISAFALFIQNTAKQEQKEKEIALVQTKNNKKIATIHSKINQGRYDQALKIGQSILEQDIMGLSAKLNEKLMLPLHNSFLNNRIITRLSTHTSEIENLEISPDGSRLLSTDLGGNTRLWNTNNWNEVAHWKSLSGARVKAWFNSNSNQVIIYSGAFQSNFKVNTYSAINGKPLTSGLNIAKSGALNIPFWKYNPDYIISRRYEIVGKNGQQKEIGYLSFYDLDLNLIKELKTPSCGEYYYLQLAIVLEKPTRFLIADKECGGNIYHSQENIKPFFDKNLRHSKVITSKILHWNKNNQQLVTKSSKDEYHLWSLSEQKKLLSFKTPHLIGLEINADEKSVVTYSCDEKLFACDVKIRLISKNSNKVLTNNLSPRYHRSRKNINITDGSWLEISNNYVQRIYPSLGIKTQLTSTKNNWEKDSGKIEPDNKWIAVADGLNISIIDIRNSWLSHEKVSVEPDTYTFTPSKKYFLTTTETEEAFLSTSDFSQHGKPIKLEYSTKDRFNWSKDENTLLISSLPVHHTEPAGYALWVDFKKHRLIKRINHVYASWMNRTGNKLKLFNDDGNIVSLDIKSPRSEKVFVKLDNINSRQAMFSHDGKILAAIDNKTYTLKLINTTSGKLILDKEVFNNDEMKYSKIYFTPYDDKLIIQPNDKPLIILDTTNLQQVVKLHNLQGLYLNKIISNDYLLLQGNGLTQLRSISDKDIKIDLSKYTNNSISATTTYSNKNKLLIETYEPNFILVDLKGIKTPELLTCDGVKPSKMIINWEKNILVSIVNKDLCISTLDTRQTIYRTPLATNFVYAMNYLAKTNQVVIVYRHGIKVVYQLQQNNITKLIDSIKNMVKYIPNN